MRIKTIGAAGAMGMAILGAVSAAGAANTLTAAEKKAGWILLFDGVDKNAHWRYNETGSQPNPWTIEDSAMRTVNTYSFLCTKSTEQFDNFEWQIDWKLAFAGNSGLFIRVLTSTYNDGYEYAILDDKNGGDRNELSKNPADKMPNGKMPPIKRDGSVYDVYPTTVNGQIGGQYYDSTASKPYGQWDHGVIFANGNYIEHWLNGRKVIDVEIGSADWDARFKNSKWNVPGISVDQWAKHPKGSLCMQAHGDNQDAWFRNIKVRPFTPGEKLNSPLITPNGGSFNGPILITLDPAITGATVRYTLDGSDPTPTSPIYKDSLKISSTGVVKTRTYRDRFQASDVASATFTIAGSSIADFYAKVRPHAAMQASSRMLSVENESGKDLGIRVVDVGGKSMAAFSTAQPKAQFDLKALKTGIYFVKMRYAGSEAIDRIYLY
jgi:hypothetical protein